jgi:hypothetical protein
MQPLLETLVALDRVVKAQRFAEDQLENIPAHGGGTIPQRRRSKQPQKA